jgi:sec-independent protein translocase protein TatB
VFNVNGWEIVVIAVIFLLVFGPERIPEAAIQLGRLVREFRRATESATSELTREIEAAAHQARQAEADLVRAGGEARRALEDVRAAPHRAARSVLEPRPEPEVEPPATEPSATPARTPEDT